MVQRGKVKYIEDENVIVNVARPSMCGGKCGDCSAQCRPTTLDVMALNSANAKIGDIVTLEYSDSHFLFGAAFAYLVPLLFMFVAYILADHFWHNDATSIIACLAVFIFTFVPFAFVDRHMKRSGKYRIVVTKVIWPEVK